MVEIKLLAVDWLTHTVQLMAVLRETSLSPLISPPVKRSELNICVSVIYTISYLKMMKVVFEKRLLNPNPGRVWVEKQTLWFTSSFLSVVEENAVVDCSSRCSKLPVCHTNTHTPTLPPTKHLPTITHTHTHRRYVSVCQEDTLRWSSYNHRSCWRLRVICVDISKKQVQSEPTVTRGLRVRPSAVSLLRGEVSFTCQRTAEKAWSISAVAMVSCTSTCAEQSWTGLKFACVAHSAGACEEEWHKDQSTF